MNHERYLKAAFLLSKKANFKDISPNPFVGAIVVDKNGNIIGEGWHKQLGGPHAEVFAIQEALKTQADLSNTILYVTLEPCSHHGKTPPCSELIIKHKISQVVIGSLDPNPLVNGVEILLAQDVKIIQLVLPEIVELNKIFNTNKTKQRPFVLLKIASTLNGKIGDFKGNSKWISNEKSRQYVHTHLRNEVDAILTTYKTVIQDNATLDIRIPDETSNELSAIVIDKNLKLLDKDNSYLSIFYPRSKSKLFLIHRAEIIPPFSLPDSIVLIPMHFDLQDKIDFKILGIQLLALGIYKLLIESGGRLNASALESGFVDEIYNFITPTVLSDINSIPSFNSVAPQKMEAVKKLTLLGVEQFANDVLLKYSIN